MAKPTYTVVPQRSDGRGYVDCEPHRATSWAVRERKKIRRGRMTHDASRILSRHATRNQAELDRDCYARSILKPRRAYKLGARMLERTAEAYVKGSG